jgi:hypothetical protein
MYRAVCPQEAEEATPLIDRDNLSLVSTQGMVFFPREKISQIFSGLLLQPGVPFEKIQDAQNHCGYYQNDCRRHFRSPPFPFLLSHL